ncbi:YitT family protein [Comamonas sp. 17RB]|uniref:YitT family protein n=1 Tax=Comamonas sp. 17RB TaxID=3047025 RepID=UPI0024B71AD0|nr:YitT family protein [Comamonas sp. 17RB]MDI9855679.1 YitT family protein [Comamonas sp. 17RB]
MAHTVTASTSAPLAAGVSAGAASSPASGASPLAAAEPPSGLRHGTFEDAQALFTGSLFVGITMMMFSQAGLLTGSTAGLAFVLHYATGWPFGAIYFAINIPFYWFSWKHIGRVFTIKTFVSVGILSLIVELGPRFIHIDYLHPVFAAIAGGLLMGTGILFLARHRSSLGGATIASLYLQERYGIRAGKVQMAIDCTVVMLALWVVPWERVAWSVLAAVVMGVFLAVSHRPGRYRGN